MATTKPMVEKQKLALRKRAWKMMPRAVEAQVSIAYYEPPHAELIETIEKAQAELIANGLLTAEEMARLTGREAADLAIKRWKQKNPTWPELPD